MADAGIFSIAPGESPQAVEMRRKIALGLLNEGMSTAPIRSGWQGAANLAKALMGGYDLYKADQSEASGREKANQQFMEGIGGMQGGPAQSPPTVPPQAPTGGQPSPGMIPGYNGEPPRPKVPSSASVMGDDEAINAGLYEGQPGGAGVPMPQANPMRSPVASALAAPAPQPAAQPTAQPQGRPPISPQLLAALGNPYLPAGHASIASHLVTNALSPEKQTFQTLPNGDILALDPTGRMQPRVVYNAPKNPTFGVIGEENGDKQHGWIDPAKRTIEPYQLPGAGKSPTITMPDGKVLTVPQGMDPKKFKEHVTTATADSMAGKLTEVQANATQFANRMEDAEKNVQKFATSAHGWEGTKGAAARWVSDSAYSPVGRGAVNWAVPDKFLNYEQSKSQFITALLRKESGAAISPHEFQRYDHEFFPQLGDPKEAIAQKAQARKVAIDAMKKGAGPVYQPPAAPAAQDLGDGWTVTVKP